MIFSSCLKVDMPKEGSRKLTYYIETDGIVEAKYSDGYGNICSVKIVNEKWHRTFDVEIYQMMSIDFSPTVDCNVGYYFAQDGTIDEVEDLKFCNANDTIHRLFSIH